MAHNVIEIRIRSFSELPLRSSLKVIAADPLIRPKDMAGQFLYIPPYVRRGFPGLPLPVVLTC